MSIQQTQDEIVEEFELFDDWDGKYEYLIDLGKKLPPLRPEQKTDENLIKGCQSRVWLDAHLQDDKLVFEGDSDAMIVKGLVALLIRVLSGHRPGQVAAADLDFLEKVGLQQHLAQTRANGLAAMVKQMKAYGLAYQARQAQ